MSTAVDATPIFTYAENRIRGQLCQGGEPPEGSAVREAGFEVLVLCAKEIQNGRYDGVLVLRCPLDDHPVKDISESEKIRARATSATVARLLRAGADVLVTCAQGRNRSGLVSAMTLRWLTGMSGEWCAEQVQRVREDALTNDSFVEFLESM